MDSLDLFYKTNDLRKLIMDNPDLPLLVFAGEEANSGDYPLMACSSVSAYIGEVLDCEQEFDECIITDREYFWEQVSEYYWKELREMPESEQDAWVDRKVAEYDPCWKKCIILEVNN